MSEYIAEVSTLKQPGLTAVATPPAPPAKSKRTGVIEIPAHPTAKTIFASLRLIFCLFILL